MRWNLAVAALATSWGFISVIVVGVTLGPVPLSVFRTAFASLTLAGGLIVARRLDLVRVPVARSRLGLSGLLLALHRWRDFAAINLAGAAVANVTAYPPAILLAVV